MGNKTVFIGASFNITVRVRMLLGRDIDDVDRRITQSCTSVNPIVRLKKWPNEKAKLTRYALIHPFASKTTRGFPYLRYNVTYQGYGLILVRSKGRPRAHHLLPMH